MRLTAHCFNLHSVPTPGPGPVLNTHCDTHTQSIASFDDSFPREGTRPARFCFFPSVYTLRKERLFVTPRRCDEVVSLQSFLSSRSRGNFAEHKSLLFIFPFFQRFVSWDFFRIQPYYFVFGLVRRMMLSVNQTDFQIV